MGKLPRPTRKLDPEYTVEPPQDGARFVELRRVGEGKEVSSPIHGPAAGHPDSAALEVLAGIMSGAGAVAGADAAEEAAARAVSLKGPG